MKTQLLVVAAVVGGTSFVSPAARAEVVMTERASVAPAPTVVVTAEHHYRRRPGPRFMVPLKIDLGWADVHTSRGWFSGIEAAVGIHWASLAPEPTNFDVGVGVFGVFAFVPSDNDPTTDDSASYSGVYLEGAKTLSMNGWGRTWAGVRGEYDTSNGFGTSHQGFGVAGRLSAELYAHGVGIAPDGLFLGTYAVGVYIEAGVRDLAPGLDDLQLTAGLTFRTPLVIAP
jgi:hypothetical protein